MIVTASHFHSHIHSPVLVIYIFSINVFEASGIGEKWKIASERILKIYTNSKRLAHMFIPQSSSTSFLLQNVCKASAIAEKWKIANESILKIQANSERLAHMFIFQSSSSSFLL